MDNLAHALVGAAIGRAVAGRRVPAPAWIGAVAANAPDWSEFFLGFRPYRGGIGYYLLHRGITHSFIGAAVETVGISALVLLGFAIRRARGAPPVPPGIVVALVGAAVASHVYMDWQGSYGLRPFLPWDGQWFYADWVAIVDPLFWLVPLVGLAWGAERHWRDLIPILLVAGLVLWLTLRADGVAVWLQAACVATVGIGAVGWVRYWYGPVGRRGAAALALVTLGLYAGAQGIASVPVKVEVRRAAVARFGPHAEWAALTRIGVPFAWEPILASPDSVAGPGWTLPRHLDDPRVRRALRDRSAARALAGFARFLVAEVDSGSAGVAVTLRDARYARPPETGWGVVSVSLPADSSRF